MALPKPKRHLQGVRTTKQDATGVLVTVFFGKIMSTSLHHGVTSGSRSHKLPGCHHGDPILSHLQSSHTKVQKCLFFTQKSCPLSPRWCSQCLLTPSLVGLGVGAVVRMQPGALVQGEAVIVHCARRCTAGAMALLWPK